MSESTPAHRKAVLRAWAIVNGLDPDELEAEVERRKVEIKAQMERAIKG